MCSTPSSRPHNQSFARQERLRKPPKWLSFMPASFVAGLSAGCPSELRIPALIKKNWKAIEGKSSLGLRHLRDVEKIACEQGRFRDLFLRAAKQVTS